MKKQTTWRTLALRILLGMGITVAVLVVLLVVIALVGANGGLSDLMCSVVSLVCVGISWGAGGFSVGLLNRKNGLLMGGLHGLCMFALILLVSLIVRGGEMTLWGWKTLFYFLAGPAISSLGGIIGVHIALKNR